MADGDENSYSNAERRAAASRAAIVQGLIGPGDEDSRVCLLIDWEHVRTAARSLHAAFAEATGPRWVHAFAAKGNPIGALLRRLHSELGLGVEAASMGELTSALEVAGVDASVVVFDSPTKTRREIAYALERGVFLNVDNLQELQRVQALLQRATDEQAGWLAGVRLGVRINPQVGGGALQGFSTADTVSKFGVPLCEQREAIVAAYVACPQLNAVHVHVGSQGMSFATQVAGVRAVVDLAVEINRTVGRDQVRIVDIGGGLSVNFASDAVAPTFADYAAALRRGVPELFAADGPFTHVFSEFGRALLAKAGHVLLNVEYTKRCGGRHIASVHAGADLFLRTVYLPDQWPLRVELLDQHGQPLAADDRRPVVETDVVGPCCFSMDVIAHRRLLPELRPGDYVLMLDTGAYYHSSYSIYNLRQAPGVYLYERTASGLRFSCLAAPQTVRDTLAFLESKTVSLQ